MPFYAAANAILYTAANDILCTAENDILCSSEWHFMHSSECHFMQQRMTFYAAANAMCSSECHFMQQRMPFYAQQRLTFYAQQRMPFYAAANAILCTAANAILCTAANAILCTAANAILCTAANDILCTAANAILCTAANDILCSSECHVQQRMTFYAAANDIWKSIGNPFGNGWLFCTDQTRTDGPVFKDILPKGKGAGILCVFLCVWSCYYLVVSCTLDPLKWDDVLLLSDQNLLLSFLTMPSLISSWQL